MEGTQCADCIELREFDTPPNMDAGEGVKTMFAEMAAAKLYPPQHARIWPHSNACRSKFAADRVFLP